MTDNAQLHPEAMVVANWWVSLETEARVCVGHGAKEEVLWRAEG